MTTGPEGVTEGAPGAAAPTQESPVFQGARRRILAQFAIRDQFVESFVDRKLRLLFRADMSVDELVSAYYSR